MEVMRRLWRGPANRVTLARAVLVGGAAALALAVAGDRWVGARGWLVAVASVALLLDALDGPVARRTGTASAFGARFDMEVDASLVLVLAGFVATDVGPWVLSIGAARYLLAAAQWVLPSLRGPWPPPPPAKRWRKAVAAVQGIALTVAAAGVLAAAPVRALLTGALVLLAVSFGTEVRELRAGPRRRLVPATERRVPGAERRVPAGLV